MLTIYHYLRDFPADADKLNGGMDKAVSGLAAGIARVSAGGVRSVVLCESPRPSFQIDRAEGYRVHSFDSTALLGKSFGVAPDLRDFVLNEIRDGLVVLHAIFHTGVNAMSKLLRRSGVPYVIAPHDPYHPAIFSGKRAMKIVYWYLFERPMLQHAASVQVLDRRHEQHLRKRGVRTPVIAVENGFEPDDVPEESSLTWRTNGPVRLLFLGRIDRINKGLDLLIDAFAPIAVKDPTITLTLQGPESGDGPLLKNQIAQLGLSKRVEIVAPDFHTRPSDLAAKFDLFVLPSRFEGFGLSAMEAMLAARPLVISNVAGLAPHIVRAECGVAVDSSVQSIRDGIEQLLARQKEWQEIGMRGRRYVMKHLDWSRSAESALRAYLSLARVSSTMRQ